MDFNFLSSTSNILPIYTANFWLDPPDNQRLANLCGSMNKHLEQISNSTGVEINNRGHNFQLIGNDQSVEKASILIKTLYEVTLIETLSPEKIHSSLLDTTLTTKPIVKDTFIKIRGNTIIGRTINQRRYLQNIATHDICFGVGPAGTGKTYLAVASGVNSLSLGEVKRIILVRPAVEAGERLGFLPGDMTQKIDPYLRPLYDALYEMLGLERVNKYIENNIIEVAPLAFMRGRTLNESFVILDEAQNTTTRQMKMFLTRIGFNTKAVIAGDITQTDLLPSENSGLRNVIDVLKNTKNICFTFFQSEDVIRHPLVGKILDAYEKYEDHQKK